MNRYLNCPVVIVRFLEIVISFLRLIIIFLLFLSAYPVPFISHSEAVQLFWMSKLKLGKLGNLGGGAWVVNQLSV